MPIVTKPSDGASQKKSDKVFNWTMHNVFHVSSKVIVGSWPGGNNYYPGSNPPKPVGTYTDNAVNHPGNNVPNGCFTRPVYYKVAGGPAYIDLSTITKFTSQAG
jgi:hypothetical protein